MVAQAEYNSVLTAKQERFARLVVAGKTQTDAYKIAFNSVSPVAKVAACKTAALPQVAALIRRLKDEANERAVLTRTEKRAILAKLARTAPLHQTRLHAIKIDNDMSGDNAAVKVEGELTLGVVLSAIAQTTDVSALPSANLEPALTLSVGVGPTLENETVIETTVPMPLPPEPAPSAAGPFEETAHSESTPSFLDAVKTQRTRSYEE